MQLPDMDTLPRASVSGASAYVIGEHRWIPAFAGMTEKGLRASAVRTIIPTFAGNDGKGPSGKRRADNHSRLRGK